MSGESGGPRTDCSEVALARAVREAVRGLPGIHDLATGRFVEAATYGPLELVRGVVVRRTDDAFHVVVHIIPEYSGGLVLPQLVDRVRAAAQQAVPADVQIWRVDVAVDDLWIEQSP